VVDGECAAGVAFQIGKRKHFILVKEKKGE
jgi:hypothetical protein